MKTFKFLNNEYNSYDTFVERKIRDLMGLGMEWRGYETYVMNSESDSGIAQLKIIGGIHAAGFLTVMYHVELYRNDVVRTKIYQLSILLDETI